MSRKLLRLGRGAATVELAIGATLWVTATLLGLWMSEVSFLSTKVQEAAAAGVWNATGRRVDDFQVANNAAANTNYAAAIAGASATTTTQYADFEGIDASGAGTQRLLARGTGMRMNCSPGAGRTPLAFDSPAATAWDDGTGRTPARINNQLGLFYRARPATLCTSSALASPWNLPQHFLDEPGPGLFNTPMYANGSIRLCGAGRARNGRCVDSYAVLLGDWAADGPRGSLITQNLPLGLDGEPQLGNLPYKDMVQRLFNQGQKPSYKPGDPDPASLAPATRFQRRMSNMVRLHNEWNFYMSYAGVEADYGDMLSSANAPIPAACSTCHFNTTGTQTVNGNPEIPDPARNDYRNLRASCFLGIGGCRAP